MTVGYLVLILPLSFISTNHVNSAGIFSFSNNDDNSNEEPLYQYDSKLGRRNIFPYWLTTRRSLNPFNHPSYQMNKSPRWSYENRRHSIDDYYPWRSTTAEPAPVWNMDYYYKKPYYDYWSGTTRNYPQWNINTMSSESRMTTTPYWNDHDSTSPCENVLQATTKLPRFLIDNKLIASYSLQEATALSRDWRGPTVPTITPHSVGRDISVVIYLIAVGIVFFIAIICSLICCCKKKKKKTLSISNRAPNIFTLRNREVARPLRGRHVVSRREMLCSASNRPNIDREEGEALMFLLLAAAVQAAQSERALQATRPERDGNIELNDILRAPPSYCEALTTCTGVDEIAFLNHSERQDTTSLPTYEQVTQYGEYV